MSPLALSPADFSKRKAVHLHRPDLGCSDVQEKGEKEEQEQEAEVEPESELDQSST